MAFRAELTVTLLLLLLNITRIYQSYCLELDYTMGVVSGRLIIESALSCRGAFSMVFPLWEKNSHLRPRLFLRRRGIPCQYRAVSCDVTSHMRIVVSHVSVQLKSIIVGANMVLCIMIGCSKRSGRDKDVSFYRIPSVLTRNAAIVLIYKKGGKIDCTN